MESREKKIKENYEKHLKAVEYVDMMAKVSEDDKRVFQKPLEFINEILRSGRFKGSRLLELGSGAVVHNIASASAFFPKIVMSDYVEDNCEELKRWLMGQSTLKQFLDIPAELEGYGSKLEVGKKLLESRIRERVKQVVRCDVLTDEVLLEELKADVTPPYDLIISSLCLESSVPDLSSFVDTLKRINKLLRPGGGLILVGFLDAKYWKVKEINFHYLEIKEEDVRKALKESGFGKIDMRVHEAVDIEYDHENFYYLAAEKI